MAVLDLEELLGSETPLILSELSRPTPAQITEATQTMIDWGFDLRMLAKAIGQHARVEQISTRSKAGQITAVRWEVSLHGSHAEAIAPG